MKRDPDVEDLRLWSVVTATVRPLRPAPHPAPKPEAATRRPAQEAKIKQAAPTPASPRSEPVRPRAAAPPAAVDVGLHRRLVRDRETAARIDLHGLTFEAARAALTAFILRSTQDGWRAALIITGKGAGGEGVIRRHAPDWLAEPPLREHIAGVSQAHRRHGGEGALYVALKRRRPG